MFKRLKAWFLRKLSARKPASQIAMAAKSEIEIDVNLKIAAQLIKAAPFMIEKYAKRFSNTGGIVSTSMRIAYEQALHDVVKLITPKNPELHGKSDQSSIQAN